MNLTDIILKKRSQIQEYILYFLHIYIKFQNKQNSPGKQLLLGEVSIDWERAQEGFCHTRDVQFFDLVVVIECNYLVKIDPGVIYDF